MDGWRAIAILLVVLQHGQDSFVAAYPCFSANVVISGIGLYGVRIFFGISGFLITSRLLDEIEERGSLGLRAFYIRRAFRILPPLVLLLAFALFLKLSGVVPIRWLEWASGALFFANWIDGHRFLGHLWSLGVEEHFYLFWPCLFAAVGSRRSAWVALALCPVLAIWRVLVWKCHWYPSPAVFWGRTDIQLDGLLLGAQAAYFSRVRRSAHWNVLRVPGFAVGCISLFVATCTLSFNDYKLSMAIYAVQAALIPMVLLGTIECPRALLSRALEWAPLKWIGRLSYGLYLWQVFLAPKADGLPPLGRIQQWPYNIASVVLCATLSYYCFERRLIRLGHRLARPVTAGRADVAEVTPNSVG